MKVVKLKIIFIFLLCGIFSENLFADQCEHLFKDEAPKNLQLLNSLKRIKNYGYFSNFVLTDTKHNKMSIVVFDIDKNDIIEHRSSLNDYIQELKDFGSEIRFVYDDYTKNQVLVSRLGESPLNRWEKNLLFEKHKGGFGVIENLKNSETIDESLRFEVFQAVLSFLARPGPQLSVIVLPEAIKEYFVESVSKVPHLSAQTTSFVIEQMNPF